MRTVRVFGHDDNSHISPDGLVLYFASDGMLYQASRATRQDPFTDRVHLGNCVNLPGFVQTGPSATVDGLELFFFSSRPGGLGGWDIWTARRQTPDDEFCDAEPVHFVNSIHRDMHSAIAAKGLALVFDSPDRPPREGGNDIWIATRTSRDVEFSPAVTIDAFSLGSDVNGPLVDFTPSLSPNWPEHGSKLYFSRGNLDFIFLQLYEATWITDSPEAVPGAVPVSPVVGEAVTFDSADSFSRGGYAIEAYTWDFGDGQNATGASVDHTFTAPGRYTVSLTIIDEHGRADSSTMNVSVVCDSGRLEPWAAVDIGGPAYPGAATFEGQDAEILCLTMCAGGADLSRSKSEGHFVYRSIAGDAVLTARLDALDGERLAKAGITFRDSLEPDAKSVSLLVENGETDQLLLQTRDESGFNKTTIDKDLTASEVWLRLQRAGDEVIAWKSANGEDWSEVERIAFVGSEDGYAGIVATVRDLRPSDEFRAATARFCSIKLEAGAASTLFLRGDCNDDGEVNLSDAACILNWLFVGEATPGCVAATNTNGDTKADITDATYLLNHLFSGGPAPVAPFPDCGPGTLLADAELGCANPPDCE